MSDKRLTGGLGVGLEPVVGPLRRLLSSAPAKWRLAFGLCPECNSDAPELYTCDVCCWYSSSDPGCEFPPPKVLRDLWMDRWKEKHQPPNAN